LCIVEFTGHLLSDRDTSSTGGAGWNGNSPWEWEENGNKTRLTLGSGMGMNYWNGRELDSKRHFRSSLVSPWSMSIIFFVFIALHLCRAVLACTSEMSAHPSVSQTRELW